MSVFNAGVDTLLNVWRNNPHIYVDQVLGEKWWSKQIEIGLAIVKHKRVFVKASHSVGKSHLLAGIASWHYDMFNPGLTIITAPSAKSVRDVMFKEIRRQRANLPNEGFRPVEPRLQKQGEEDHYLVGETAVSGEAFAGKHEEHNLIGMDEAVGIKEQIWTATKGMMVRKYSRQVAICNPTDTASYAYAVTQRADSLWHVITISALDHPNILAGIRGEPIPYPKAVQIEFVDDTVIQNCNEVDERDKRSKDFYWALPNSEGRRNPDSPKLYRPDAFCESRMLGLFPSESTGSIWSETAWNAAARNSDSGLKPMLDQDVYCHPLEIGCDVAWSANDKTSIIARRGDAALQRRTGSGWRPPIIAEELKAVIFLQIQKRNDRLRHLDNFVGEDPAQVLIKCDHDATGDALREYMAGYNFTTLSGARSPIQDTLYNNGRSESWFTVSERADRAGLDLSRLGDEAISEMRPQAMAQKWTMDAHGRRCADKKPLTRKILGRSPDDLDALNNAFSQPKGAVMRAPVIASAYGGLIGLHGAGSMIAGAGTPASLGPAWNAPLQGFAAERSARECIGRDGSPFDIMRGPVPPRDGGR